MPLYFHRKLQFLDPFFLCALFQKLLFYGSCHTIIISIAQGYTLFCFPRSPVFCQSLCLLFRLCYQISYGFGASCSFYSFNKSVHIDNNIRNTLYKQAPKIACKIVTGTISMIQKNFFKCSRTFITFAKIQLILISWVSFYVKQFLLEILLVQSFHHLIAL